MTPLRVMWAPSMGFRCSPEHRTTTGDEAPKHCAPASRGIRLLGMPCLRPIREPSSPRRRFRLPSASTCNSANTFRPRGFSPPRRLTPVPASSILQLDTEQGSLCFSAEPPTHNKAEAPPEQATRASPQRSSHPSKNSARQQPYRVTTALATLVVCLRNRSLHPSSAAEFPQQRRRQKEAPSRTTHSKEYRSSLPAAPAPSVRRPHYTRLPLRAGPPKHPEPTPKCWSFPVDFRALLHRRVRTVWTVSSTATAYPSMGFVPLQGAALPDSCPPPHGAGDTRRSRSSSRYTASLLRFRTQVSKLTSVLTRGVCSGPQFSTASSRP